MGLYTWYFNANYFYLHTQLFDKKSFRLLILDSIEGHSVKIRFYKICYYSPTNGVINYDKNLAAAFSKASGLKEAIPCTAG